MASCNLAAFKAAGDSRLLHEKLSSERRRDCLILILHHLQNCGLSQTAAQLKIEAENIVSQYDHADNIDLLHILADYEDYYALKYGGEKPRYSRRCNTDPRGSFRGKVVTNSEAFLVSRDCISSHENVPRTGNIRLLAKRRNKTMPKRPNESCGRTETNRFTGDYLSETTPHHSCLQDNILPDTHNVGSKTREPHCISSTSNMESLHVGGCTISPLPSQDENHSTTETFRTIKSIPTFGGDVELKALAMTIQQEILDQSPGVSWDDIVQLDDAKKILTEAIILPLKYPFLFQGLLEPWRGVLLYGPPGTGKTLLARAVASQSSATFFNLSASSLVSKYRGDSEKLIRVLFSLARYNSPSTIFIDEVDSIMGHRGSSQSSSSSHSHFDGGGHGSEHEGSRRMKTELLVEMDGLGKGSGHVFVLVATNMPWDLDPAFLRRLEKRILVPMPSKDARKVMMQSHFSGLACTLTEENYDHLATLTEGFSGADIKLLCKEAAMRPVREILQQIESLDTRKSCSKNNPFDLQKMSQTLLSHHPLSMKHVEDSLTSTNHSVGSELCQKYILWSNKFGSH